MAHTATLLNALAGRGDPPRARKLSLIRLMQEFLRREVLWGRAVGGDVELPFGDIAARVGPEIRCSDRIIAEAMRFRMSSAEGYAVTRLLHWATIQDTQADVIGGFGLPDLTEPMVAFFSAGEGSVFIMGG